MTQFEGYADIMYGIFDFDLSRIGEGFKKVLSGLAKMVRAFAPQLWDGIVEALQKVLNDALDILPSGLKSLFGIQPANAIQGGGAVSNAVSNNSSNTNAQIGSIVIQTNATDAQGIAHDAYSAFYDEFELAYAYQSGVNYK